MSLRLGAESKADSHTSKHRAASRRWRTPGRQLAAALVMLAGLAVFLYPHTAAWFSQKEQSRVTELAQAKLNEPPLDDAQFQTDEMIRAHAYNDALTAGAIYRANENAATGEGESTDASLVYSDMLDPTDTGFMGRLRYESLTIDLPIYHGTSDETLERGVGHLEGTSLPVGGIGNRSVLTAHRGLPTATLFNELDRAAVGDTVTVSVLNEVFTYRVVETKVIEPDQTAEILPDPDHDLLTLVTCTPLGINSHRILVTAERVTPTPIEDVKAAQQVPDLPGFPWWAVIFGSAVVGLGWYVVRSGRVSPRQVVPQRTQEHSATHLTE